jgi:CDP-diacylglycerol--serine O-phosphatidyltransferase
VRKIHILPNLLTLANSFCGLLAICKGIDALAFSQTEAGGFYSKIETACWLIFLGMLFDAIDGKVARMVGGASNFGAQLDSFSDMLTFGVAPAVIAKVLIEHEGPLYGYHVNARLHFIGMAVYSTMAILRLARFNLENDPDETAHRQFRGLPSPAAAGAVAATMLMYLSLKTPEIETSDGTPTPLGALLRWFPEIDRSPTLFMFLPGLAILLPVLGLLMVSRVRYVHMFSAITGRGQFFTLVGVVISALCLFLAPVLAVFLVFNGYVWIGLARGLRPKRPAAAARAGAAAAPRSAEP